MHPVQQHTPKKHQDNLQHWLLLARLLLASLSTNTLSREFMRLINMKVLKLGI